jgi:endonuclease-8
MYKAELCFLQGLDPWLPVRDVTDLSGLLRQAQRVLEANKLRTAQATTGDTRRGRQLWVYRREGQPCRRCATPIQVHQQGEHLRERATYWCPRCQPGPGPSAEPSPGRPSSGPSIRPS